MDLRLQMKFLDDHSETLRPLELLVIIICITISLYCVYKNLTVVHNDLMLMGLTMDFIALLNILIISSAIALDKRKTMHNDLQIFLFCLAALVLAFDCLTGFMEGIPGLATWNYLAYLVKNLLFLLISLLYMRYLFVNIHLSEEKSAFFYTLANSIAFFALILMAINFVFNILFDIDSEGQVVRGPLRAVYLLCAHGIGSIALLTVFRYDDDRRERIVAAIILAATWTLYIIDNIAMDLSPVYLIPVLILIISFSNNYIYRSEVLSKKEVLIAKKNTELADLKFNAMVTQMQPHFLYNALTSIVNIKGNPPETRDAIIDFAAYLRTNLNTINNPHPIPFSKELDHIETYLSLEKLRFKDKLDVVWHINDRRFVIPALTAQTMVENAVRHGVSKREGGGRVIIVSEAVEDGHMIKVIDNGVGYDPNAPAPNDGRAHIGISSARERLKAMCNGTLTVKSTLGVGTTVTIFIPEAGFTEEVAPEPEPEDIEEDPGTENE